LGVCGGATASISSLEPRFSPASSFPGAKTELVRSYVPSGICAICREYFRGWRGLDLCREEALAAARKNRRAAKGETMGDFIKDNLNGDGVDRRGFLKCMAWAGTGTLCVLQGGLLKSFSLSAMTVKDAAKTKGELSFVQISDSHIGFDKAANPDVSATLRAAIEKINALPQAPEFILHTGDLSHLSKASEFDTLDQLLKGVKTDRVFYVPGEHDVLNDNGAQYRERYGKETKGDGWYSFDKKGVHFVGLVNVMNLKAGGLGTLGHEQLEWLEDDVKHLKASTPIVVFAHIPLWAAYPEWGWGTDDSAQALGYLKRFGSISVLNGHIHQVMQKVEGNVTFHTAMSTAFPQPEPGKAPSPGPMKVPAEQLRTLLGVTDVNFVRGKHTLAVVDAPLVGAPRTSEYRVGRPAFQDDTDSRLYGAGGD
jgi:3',5'-cyclic-AMP phosphodiesterase